MYAEHTVKISKHVTSYRARIDKLSFRNIEFGRDEKCYFYSLLLELIKGFWFFRFEEVFSCDCLNNSTLYTNMSCVEKNAHIKYRKSIRQ